MCRIGKVGLPLRWDRAPGDELDERLRFEAACAGRERQCV
jgi:hypothetical protein